MRRSRLADFYRVGAERKSQIKIKPKAAPSIM
jgi:hypothetical protein